MDRLNNELTRLYGPLAGQSGDEVRTIAIPFRKRKGGEARHWEDLCAVANALQDDYGFPAPAVSIASSGGYVLWLSLAAPVPVATAREFVALLGQSLPDVVLAADVVGGPVALPPALDPATGRWAAFIHPGMGASFADESGLDMEPPAAGQLGFVEGLRSIGADQFQDALASLRQAARPAEAGQAAHPGQPVPSAAPEHARTPARAAPAATAAPPGIPDDLLLKDATLEDIVRLLHARHIEPTFRHLIPPG